MLSLWLEELDPMVCTLELYKIPRNQHPNEKDVSLYMYCISGQMGRASGAIWPVSIYNDTWVADKRLQMVYSFLPGFLRFGHDRQEVRRCTIFGRLCILCLYLGGNRQFYSRWGTSSESGSCWRWFFTEGLLLVRVSQGLIQPLYPLDHLITCLTWIWVKQSLYNAASEDENWKPLPSKVMEMSDKIDAWIHGRHLRRRPTYLVRSRISHMNHTHLKPCSYVAKKNRRN